MKVMTYTFTAIVFCLMIGNLNAEILELGTIDTHGDANDAVFVSGIAFIKDKIEGLGPVLSYDINLVERYQNDPSKMNRAKLAFHKLPESPNPVLKVFIYFKHKPDNSLMYQLEQRGFRLFPESWIPPVGKHPYGFMIANAEASQIKDALRDELAERIVAAYREVEPYNDLAAVETGTVEAREEYEYDGEGVRLAIIDSGFELDHPDLPTPEGFIARDYSLYPDAVDNDVTDHQSKHGTHVAGTAFGTGELSEGRFQGMAPGVTPVYLKVGDDERGAMTDAAIVGAIRACAVEFDVDIANISLGGWFYNDGSGAPDQAVDFAVSEGVTVFAAAGNEANDARHYFGTVAARSCTERIEIEWEDIQEDDWLSVFICWYDSDNPDVRIPLSVQFTDVDDEEITGDIQGPASSSRGTEAILFNAEDPFPEESGSVYISIDNDTDQEQDFHIYIWNKKHVSFTEPSEFYTIGSPAVADNAIAVAAYTSRSEWTNFQGREYTVGDYPVGGLAYFSSRGPRIDGANKPDIAAPGQMIISCRNRDIVELDGDLISYIVGNDGGEGEPADYLALQGTSMASPAAAGAAALILQDDPELTPAELRELILDNARTDNFTGDNPDWRFWGRGKLDIMNILGERQTPHIVVDPQMLEFGEVVIGQIREQIITISNEGDADLRIDDIFVEGVYFNNDFEEELVIEPDANYELTVVFAPEEAGEFDGMLTIVSDDPDEGEVEVVLTGVGIVEREIREVGHYNTPGLAHRVFVLGSYAFVADRQSGLQIVDISDPAEPGLAGNYRTAGYGYGVFVRDNFVYVAEGAGNDGLRVVDISNIAEPALVGGINTTCAYNVEVEGDLAYIAESNTGLHIIDISDPEDPSHVSTCNTPGNSWNLKIAGDLVYIADLESGMQIIDISDPEQPDIIGSFNAQGEVCGVYVVDDIAYVAASGLLHIVDVSDPSEPNEISNCNTPGRAQSVFVAGNFAFIADGISGLCVVDVSNSDNPEVITSFDTQGNAFDVKVVGEYVFLADGDNGLIIIDVSDFTGTFPDISVQPDELDFSEVHLEESEELTLTISNNGRAALTVSDITVVGDYFSTDFEEEFVLEPEASYELTVVFATEEAGEFEGTLTIFSDDLENGEVIVPLSGIGIQRPDPVEFKITADDGASGDQFGVSVSIDGDYAVVGAFFDDDDGRESGSAYIFIRDGDDWTEQAKLTANDAAAGDQFGNSVSIDGDYAVIGARCNDDDGDNSGSAYIFIRDGDDWTEQAKLTANDAAAGDGFGNSVSIDGNYAVVGAFFDDDDGEISGSAYIFIRDGDGWTEQAKLTANDAAANDYFGISVSIDGDYVVVGAHGNDDDGRESGSAYIFVRDGDDWTEQVKVTANDAAAGDSFGSSVFIDGDYVVIGAYLDDDGGRESGSAYIFIRDGDGWTEQTKLTASDAAANDRFGVSVSISGDYAVVGAYLDDDDGNNSGSAYIFVRDGDNWTEQAKLTANDAAAGDEFGRSPLSISSNYAIVGAVYNDDDGEQSGSAYIYQLFEGLEEPNIAVSTESLDFGAVPLNESSEQILTISNEGDAALTVSDITVEGDYFSTDFEDEFVLEPDASYELTVVFAPEETGEFEGNLTVFSDDPENGEVIVPLSGIGIGRVLTVPLTEGWNMISINIIPQDENLWVREEGPDVARMLEQLRIDEEQHHVQLFKDGNGRFYAPAFGFSNIPYWNLVEGYQVNVDEAVEAVWIGEQIPADADVPIFLNWNIVAYLPSYDLDASAPDFYVLSPIIDNVEIAKDAAGRFLSPRFNFSNMQPWRETQGYQIKVSEDVVLNYPPEQEELNFIARTYGTIDIKQTSNNMSLLLNGCESGQIVALTSDGVVIGIGTIDSDGRCGLAVWGDDESTDDKDGLAEGERFELKYLGTEIELEVKAIHTGNGLVYETNSFTVIDVTPKAEIPDDYYLSQNYPNPFNSTTRITYGLPDAGHVSLSVYDISGRVVQTLVDMQLTAGHHTVEWDAGQVSSGLYLVRFEASNFKAINKVVLAK